MSKQYRDKQIEELKPDMSERVYAEWDEEFCYYSVFGSDSGFCYGQYGSHLEAEMAAETINKKVKMRKTK
jgi:hypothetical protein